tara:strand:+ start:180 stop:374 length:195 start_codon:yes stop_codon:yes gene_type:complete
MSILFGIFLFLNAINPENQDFVKQTLDNNKKYNCEFVYKGISAPTDKPAITLFGYTMFKQKCLK